ncbi:MAG TPA: SusD/RagB family nutrient-binding outer membrane lipoprotein, partial [Chitinophagaceae bacterium]|nr:SusD/RagB family nutrient-binding outer membrane lipoprotein [Chitinophagaceae bacterium]
MKNLSNKLLLFTALFSLSVISCRKQLDINQNPNDVTESNITADLILPNALHGVGVQTANGYGWLANWMGYWSPSGSFAPSTEESTYNISSLFGEAKWAGVYNVLYDLETVDNKSTAGNQRFYKALAKIMKAHLYQNLVDIWGDVPYSEAFKIPEVRTPKYDKAEDIYADL